MADSKNVKVTVKGTKLTMEVDLTKDFGPSKSGKTKIIGTSSGAMDVPGREGVKVNLNVYSKAE